MEFCRARKSRFMLVTSARAESEAREGGVLAQFKRFSYMYMQALRETVNNECRKGCEESYCAPDEGRCRLDLLQ